MDYLIGSNVDTVVLAAAWVNFFNAPYMEVDDREFARSGVERSTLVDRLSKTIQNLQATGKQVVVVYPVPRFEKPVMDVMAARIIKGERAPDFDYPYNDFTENTAVANDILNTSLNGDAGKILPEKIFCDTASATGCQFGRDGVAYIVDRGHYTTVGAHMIVDRIADEMVGAESASGPTAFQLN